MLERHGFKVKKDISFEKSKRKKSDANHTNAPSSVPLNKI